MFCKTKCFCSVAETQLTTRYFLLCRRPRAESCDWWIVDVREGAGYIVSKMVGYFAAVAYMINGEFN